MMMTERWVYGGNLLRIRNKTILTKLNWLPIVQEIKLALVKVLHSIIVIKEPKDLYEMLRIPRRKTAQIAMKKYLKKQKLMKSMIYTAVKSWKRRSFELELVLMPKQNTRKSPVEQGKR